jgi:hypothetical protein
MPAARNEGPTPTTTVRTPAYVEIQRAATWIELGRPERVITLFEDSLARLPSVHRRDRGVYLARLASAYALSGSPDVSVRKGWEALTPSLPVLLDTE